MKKTKILYLAALLGGCAANSGINQNTLARELISWSNNNAIANSTHAKNGNWLPHSWVQKSNNNGKTKSAAASAKKRHHK